MWRKMVAAYFSVLFEIFPREVRKPRETLVKVLISSTVNLLKTKRNLLYIRNQSVPRSKHFPPQL